MAWTKTILASHSHVSRVGRALAHSRLVVALRTSHASFLGLAVCLTTCVPWPFIIKQLYKGTSLFLSFDCQRGWLCQVRLQEGRLGSWLQQHPHLKFIRKAYLSSSRKGGLIMWWKMVLMLNYLFIYLLTCFQTLHRYSSYDWRSGVKSVLESSRLFPQARWQFYPC